MSEPNERQVFDVVAEAAYTHWATNGHDTKSALWSVSAQHADPDVRNAAVEAHDAFSRTPLVQHAFDRLMELHGQLVRR